MFLENVKLTKVVNSEKFPVSRRLIIHLKMTRILFRKTYLLTILVIGITFWGFVTLIPDVSLSSKENTQPARSSYVSLLTSV